LKLRTSEGRRKNRAKMERWRRQDAQQETYITTEYDTTVVAVLAAPQALNLTGNPNRPRRRRRRRRKENPKWYARSHPKMATPYNGAPPLLL
jgi:ferric-dicitrate binding protein FerR (iron transport regulator)